MGRKSLRRCSIRHRNRAAPRHRGSRSHPSHLEWNAVTRPGPVPIRVSNYADAEAVVAASGRPPISRPAIVLCAPTLYMHSHREVAACQKTAPEQEEEIAWARIFIESHQL